jgi:flagellar hook-basal body complex protein FliE
MDVTALSSIGNLGATARSGATGETAAASGSGPSFADVLGQIIANGVNTIQGGESAAIQGLNGAEAPFKVVESVMSAQRTLQEGLSIRDKVVSAYQEISRMAL